jgi:hypothetical protein
MTQPPYGQNPYTPTSQYPSAPSPYVTPGNPVEPVFAQQPAYPMSPPPQYMPAPPPKKSPVLGFVGVGVVIVCAIVFFIAAMALYKVLFDAMGTDTNYDFAAMPPSVQQAAMGPALGLTAASLAGLVGFIISIIATAQNKGRIFGIVGIILGVLAPFSLFIAAGISMANYGAI